MFNHNVFAFWTSNFYFALTFRYTQVCIAFFALKIQMSFSVLIFFFFKSDRGFYFIFDVKIFILFPFPLRFKLLVYLQKPILDLPNTGVKL